MMKLRTRFLGFFVLIFAIAGFAAHVHAQMLTDQVNEALKASHPDCKPTKPLMLLSAALTSAPTVMGTFECGGKRTLSVRLHFSTSDEDQNLTVRMFHMRSIMPPQRNVEEFGFNPSMFSMNGRVEMQFVKNRVVYNLQSEFPIDKSKSPHYHFRGPAMEESFMLSIARSIEKADTTPRVYTPCENNFAWPPQDFGVSTEAQLFTAIIRGDHKRVVTLIGLGANVEANFGNAYFRTRNDEELKPLHLAIAKGCLKSVEALIDAEASVNAVNAIGETPLMFAASVKDVEAVRLLLANGANPGSRTTYGLTAAFFLFEDFLARVRSRTLKTTHENYLQILKLLKENGANLRETDSRNGDTLLHRAAKCSGVEDCQIVLRTLVDEGLDVNAVNADGQTPLFTVLSKLNPINVPVVFGLLLELGADPNIKTKDGETVYTYIEKNNKDEYFKPSFETILRLLRDKEK